MTAAIRRRNHYALDTTKYGVEDSWPRLLGGRYDGLFKLIVTAEWCVKSDGDVTASSGYFSLTEIPSHPGELKEMYEALSDSHFTTTEYSLDKWPDAGWYVTLELDNGLIFVFEYPTKEAAEKAYTESNDEYERWLNGEAY